MFSAVEIAATIFAVDNQQRGCTVGAEGRGAAAVLEATRCTVQEPRHGPQRRCDEAGAEALAVRPVGAHDQ